MECISRLLPVPIDELLREVSVPAYKEDTPSPHSDIYCTYSSQTKCLLPNFQISTKVQVDTLHVPIKFLKLPLSCPWAQVNFVFTPNSSQMGPLHIVALGSSFAAGFGVQPVIDRAAKRSGNNYAHLLAERLSARLTDLTVSGATLANMLGEPQVLFGNRFEPQLHGVPADDDLVTITDGGKDLNYIGFMMADSVRAYLIGRLFMPAAPQAASLDTDALADRFVDLIDKVLERAPHARILLVEYLTLIGPDARAGVDVAFDESRVRFHRKTADILNAAYSRAGKSRPDGVMVIDMAQKSLGHGLGSDHPWVDPLSVLGLLKGKPCLHPNLNGMKAVADALYESLSR